jgi:hypothetical protein
MQDSEERYLVVRSLCTPTQALEEEKRAVASHIQGQTPWLKYRKFITLLETGHEVWNRRRRVDREFLLAECTELAPHVEHGVVPDELLDEFCFDRGKTFLGAVKLMQHFGTLSLEEGAQKTVERFNLMRLTCGAEDEIIQKATFKDCPLVWDTGASFGLTPFRGDFLDYVECKITVIEILLEKIQ